jgi:hypothetical protein
MSDGGSDEAIQRAIADACLARDPSFTPDLRRFFEERGVGAEDVAAMTTSPARLGVYRSLVRNGLSNVVARVLPRTRARFDAACPGRFGADFAAFVDEVGPRTHFLRDVPAELLGWAQPRWRADPSVPAYLPDFAAFELAGFAVGAAADLPKDAPLQDVGPDRALVLHPSTITLHLGWAVHELSQEPDARDEPEARNVDLLGHRDTDHAVRWLELTPLAAAIVGRLLAGEPLRSAVARACELERAAYDVNAAAALLAELAARGVVAGARDL